MALAPISFFLLALLFGLVTSQLSFGGGAQNPSVDVVTEGTNDTVNPRLGLLASSLGVEPVPGASTHKGVLNQDRYPGGGLYGGNGGGAYPAPGYGPKCECVPKQYCSGRPGAITPGGGGPGGNGQQGGNYGKENGEYIDAGLLPGQGSQTNPEVDGTGNIDIRIVNRLPVGIVCGPEQIYCCESGRDGPGPIHVPPPAQSCGIPTIINVPGHKEVYGQADFGEYPWLAVILSTSNNYVGAGALLDSYHVLTAAHKVKDYKPTFPMKVRLGEWNAQDDSEPYKNIEIEVARVDIHPNFNADNLQNDVAILKLAQPIDTLAYPHIKSVCLPKQNSDFIGKRCWVPGFGKDAFKVGKHSYYLREVDLPIVDSADCEARLRQTRLGGNFQLNRKSFICAGGEDGKDACTGDGGSPLVCKGYDGRFQVVGLVAWGIGCADYGIPGVYVNVPSYSNWIEGKLAY